MDRKSLRQFVPLAIALIVAGGAWAGYGGTRKTIVATYSHTQAIPNLSEESRSKIPAGFPRYLIIGENPDLFFIQDLSSQTPPEMRVAFHVDANLSDTVSEYREYLKNVLWKVTEESASAEQVFLSATSNRAVSKFTFISEGEGTNVSIVFYPYVKKSN